MIRNVMVSLALVAAVAGCDDLPISTGNGSISPEMRQDYLAAVASVGCILRDERQYGAVDFQAGLSREQTLAITSSFLSKGKAERLSDGNSIRITTGPCAA